MSYGTYHLANNNDLYEPSRSNNFEFLVTDVDNLLRAGVDRDLADEADYITNGQEVIRVSVNKSSVPHFELGTIEIKRGNNVIKFAGNPTFGSGSIELHDYIGARTKDALMAWQALAYDVRTEKVFSASNYKKECKLIEYTPDYNTKIRTWVLKGCWVKSISEGEFNNESADKRLISATIEYDKAWIEE